MQEFAGGKILLSLDGNVGSIRISNPDKLNAMTPEMWEGLACALAAAGEDPSLRVLVLRGTEGKAFISGSALGFGDEPLLREQVEEMSIRTEAWTRLIRELRVPVIAGIEGFCLGGGMMVALEADIRIASSDARFGIPAAKLGIAFPLSGIQALVEVVGAAQARRLMYTGAQLGAEESLRIGLVSEVVDVASFEERFTGLATTIAANSPLSNQWSKSAIAAAMRGLHSADFDEGLQWEVRCASSRDYVEGHRAFRGRRAPVFEGC